MHKNRSKPDEVRTFSLTLKCGFVTEHEKELIKI